MSKKINNLSTVGTNEQKTLTTWDEYYCLASFSRVIISDETIRKWAKDMMDEVDTHPDPRYLSEFYKPRKIDLNDFNRLCAKYPPLMEAKKYYLRAIAENVHRRSVDGKANWNAVKGTLWRHGEEWAADDKHASELKEEVNKQGNITIQMVNAKPTTEVETQEEKKQRLLEGK